MGAETVLLSSVKYESICEQLRTGTLCGPAAEAALRQAIHIISPREEKNAASGWSRTRLEQLERELRASESGHGNRHSSSPLPHHLDTSRNLHRQRSLARRPRRASCGLLSEGSEVVPLDTSSVGTAGSKCGSPGPSEEKPGWFQNLDDIINEACEVVALESGRAGSSCSSPGASDERPGWFQNLDDIINLCEQDLTKIGSADLNGRSHSASRHRPALDEPVVESHWVAAMQQCRHIIDYCILLPEKNTRAPEQKQYVSQFVMGVVNNALEHGQWVSRASSKSLQKRSHAHHRCNSLDDAGLRVSSGEVDKWLSGRMLGRGTKSTSVMTL